MTESASGTRHGYSVEVRLDYPQPMIINTGLASVTLDNRWTPLPQPFIMDLDRPRLNDYPLLWCGLLSYQSAESVRWRFIADAERDFNHLCIETRIVAHKTVYSVSTERVFEFGIVGGEKGNHLAPTAAVEETEK